MKYLLLSLQEAIETEALLNRIMSGSPTINIDEFLLEAQIFSHQLPERVRRFFYAVKLTESSNAICVKNNPVDDSRIGKTPIRLPDKEKSSYAIREDVLHILYASLLGEPIGWTTQQNGRILNEVIPIKEHENKLISSGSSNLFDLHTEDAFHPYTADFIGLMCLRNPDKVPTVISSIDKVELDDEVKCVLFEPRFFVGANISHTVKQPQDRVPILYGDKNSPYMRINLNVQHTLEDDKVARNAMNVLGKALIENIEDVILEQGDYLYLDNFKVAHGRKAYVPKYDGTDRWLKRLTITSSLRKSRDLRDTPQSRVIKPRENP